MKNSFLVMYITGFLQAAKMLLEYPYIDKLWDSLDLSNTPKVDKYLVKGFVLIGLVVGCIGSLILWFFTLLISNKVGVFLGGIVLFLILSLKDKFSGLITFANYLSLRFTGNSHSNSWQIINNGNNFDNNQFYGATLGFLILIKAIGCFIIVGKGCEFMLIPLLMINYFAQGFFASCRSLNEKAFFYLELHDLENYCIFSAVLLFIGVHFNFVIWLFGLFVFGLIYWGVYKSSSQNNKFCVNTLNLIGEVSEVILLIIFSLYLI